MVASRVDEEISILRGWRRMPGEYDETAKRVNASYAETGNIRLTMRETRLPFSVVWEMLGFKDEMDWMETEGYYMVDLIDLLILGFCVWMILRHPPEIPVLPVQGWIPTGSGIWCVPHPLTPHPPDFLP